MKESDINVPKFDWSTICILIVLVISIGNRGPCMICQLFVIHGWCNNFLASALKAGSLLKHYIRKSLHSGDMPSGNGGQSS